MCDKERANVTKRLNTAIARSRLRQLKRIDELGKLITDVLLAENECLSCLYKLVLAKNRLLSKRYKVLLAEKRRLSAMQEQLANLPHEAKNAEAG
uniref:BZIP domain-containing protein n=1 Tax=Angiostrongylus cantonensis TaxID=6313 RepID=A0A0K0CWG0_ANGCA